MALEVCSLAKSPQGSKKLDDPREVSRDLLSAGPPQAASLKVATTACSGPATLSLQRRETQAVRVGRRHTLNSGQLILGSWVTFISVQLFIPTQVRNQGWFCPHPRTLDDVRGRDQLSQVGSSATGISCAEDWVLLNILRGTCESETKGDPAPNVNQPSRQPSPGLTGAIIIIIEAPFIKRLPCARSCAKHLTYIILEARASSWGNPKGPM